MKACRYWYNEQMYQISFKLKDISSLQAVKTFFPPCAYKKHVRIDQVFYKKHCWEHITQAQILCKNTISLSNEMHQYCEHREN